MSTSAADRSTGLWVLLAVLLSLWTAACDSPKSRAALNVGPDGALVIGDGGPVMGGAVVLPGGFTPAISCGGLGQTCGASAKCPSGLDCAGANCMPKPDGTTVPTCGDKSCPAEAPVCLLGICLTVDQLACVCAEPDAQIVYRQCWPLLVRADGECIEADGLCDTAPETCCDGLSCLQGTDDAGRKQLGLCRTPCKTSDDCGASRCCATALGVAGSFCGPRELCVSACREESEECDADFRPCCEGLVCADSPQDPTLDGCKQPCAKDGQCATGCCVLFTSGDHGVCGPRDRCPPAP